MAVPLALALSHSPPLTLHQFIIVYRGITATARESSHKTPSIPALILQPSFGARAQSSARELLNYEWALPGGSKRRSGRDATLYPEQPQTLFTFVFIMHEDTIQGVCVRVGGCVLNVRHRVCKKHAHECNANGGFAGDSEQNVQQLVNGLKYEFACGKWA